MQLFAVINSIISLSNATTKQRKEAKILKKSTNLSYQAFIFITFGLLFFATITLSQEASSDDSVQLMEKRRAFAFAKRRAFAFAKRNFGSNDFGGRSFAFAKRSSVEPNEEIIELNDGLPVDKRFDYGFNQFAFAKRALPKFAFAKKWSDGAIGGRSFAFA